MRQAAQDHWHIVSMRGNYKYLDHRHDELPVLCFLHRTLFHQCEVAHTTVRDHGRSCMRGDNQVVSKCIEGHTIVNIAKKTVRRGASRIDTVFEDLIA